MTKITQGYGIKVNEITTNISEKGQFEELEALYETLSGKTKKWPIEFWDMTQTTEVSFAV